MEPRITKKLEENSWSSKLLWDLSVMWNKTKEITFCPRWTKTKLHWVAMLSTFQNSFLATKICSFPGAPGSDSEISKLHPIAFATLTTWAIMPGESRMMTVPSGRRIRSISIITSARLHLQQCEYFLQLIVSNINLKPWMLEDHVTSGRV